MGYLVIGIVVFAIISVVICLASIYVGGHGEGEDE